MKRAKAEKPVYAFIVKRSVGIGLGLIPEMEIDRRALDGTRDGQRVRVEIIEWRNLDRLRAYWAMLGEVIEATECALSPDRLHKVLKIAIGCTEHIRLPNGSFVEITDSIAIDNMPEPEFVEFFKRAERWLAETYGWVPKERSA